MINWLTVNTKTSIIFLILTWLAGYSLSAQELGKPFIRNYSAAEYNAGSIMFDVAQDERGILLFANAWNIRIYDGVHWNDANLSNQRSAYCVEKGNDGLIYVSGDNEFGYMAPDQQGKLSYHSLRNTINEEIGDLGPVQHCYNTPSGIVFIAANHVILWDGKKSTMWSFAERISGSFYTDALHINLVGKGLHQFTNDEFTLVNGGEQFQDKVISAGLSFHDNRLLIATQSQGVYISDAPANYQSFELFPTNLDSYFRTHNITSAIKMSSGAIAFGTFTGGAVIVGPDFKLMCYVDKSTGLQDEGVINLFEDKDQILWLALRNGTSRVEITTPINQWDESSGLFGFVRTVKRFEGILYAGTTKGLFCLKDHGNGHSEFKKLEGINSDIPSSYIYEHKNGRKQFLLMTNEGLFQVKKVNGTPKVELLLPAPPSGGGKIVPAHQPSNRIYILTGNQVRVYHYQNGKWIDDGYLQGLDDINPEILSADYNGTVWAIKYGTDATRFQVTYDGNGYWAANKESFGMEDGLPDNKFIGFQLLPDDFILTSEKGVYHFNDDSKRFELATEYGPQIADYYTGFYFFEQDKKGNLWYNAYQNGDIIWREVAYKQPDGSFEIDSVSLRRIPVTDSWIEGTYADKNGVMWFGGTFGLYKYNDNQNWSAPTTFDALVRKVTTGEDSLIFAGAFPSHTENWTPKVGKTQDLSKTIEIPYHANSLIFHFASNSFFDERSNEYSYKLEGSSEDYWSHWEQETKEHIQNLSEGDYIFRVKARNIYGIESQEATFTFTILPPWYRTKLAYFAYSAAAVLLVWLIVQLNLARLRRQKENLELEVKNRTEKIQQQAETLQQANEEITAKNEEITAANEEILSKNETLAQQQEELLTKSEEISKQNEMLENTNRKITDSINYASKIQRAILGGQSVIENNFKDAFLYLKPKDIVSGDFYWYSECKASDSQQKKKLLIAADCTGHGVPGAFMTVMGSSILNEIVNHNEILEPNQILAQLDEKVIAATHRQQNGQSNSNGQVQDGMDMQVLLIDNWNAKLYFAGAKNPLYRVRDHEMTVFNGSRFPIGSSQFKENKRFDLQEIDMLPGDKFYIASDGYQDQFGGLDGRKFLRKRFRNLLLDISKHSMTKQKEVLEKTFNNWKGHHKQTDDILIIGFEV